ncbi:MAG: DNA/RNA nuclease SfsA [Candidatus Pacebacteria bacterium]|nr:DNA/RNA nuclease SfsA [Candidatus Paceibacterota bacterium]
MQFHGPLIHGRLMRRYKRFIADVVLDDGRQISAHCPNSGSMKTCQTPGWRVLLTTSENPKRKYRCTWELVHNGVCWIGINTLRANAVVLEGIHRGVVGELAGYDEIRREVRYGTNSRIDLLLSREGDPRLCYVEVKNVTLVGEDGSYCFPDAVTIRGRKHLDELSSMVAEGHRAVMLYVIQRSDGCGFRAAHEIDPGYAAALREALAAGVEAYAYRADVSPQGIRLAEGVAVRVV